LTQAKIMIFPVPFVANIPLSSLLLPSSHHSISPFLFFFLPLTFCLTCISSSHIILLYLSHLVEQFVIF
jgi:hypothetical protein